MRNPKTTDALFAPIALVLSLGTAQAQDAIPVRTVSPLRVAIAEQRELSGSLTALRNAALSPRESGIVAELLVEVGDQVSAGQALLRLDQTLTQLQAAQSQASLDEALIRLEEAERVSKESAELADQRNVARTQARAAAAQARILQAAAASAGADAKLAAERVRRHTLTAPFAGAITARHVDLGEWVNASAAVFDLIDTQQLRFDLQVPQELHNRVQVGDAASLRLDALGEQKVGATVTAVVPIKDPTARTFLVRLTPQAEGGALAPGMSGRALLVINQQLQAWTLPRDALVRYPDGSRGVWIVESGPSGDVARARQVELGVETDTGVEIRSGISGGERVVDRGNERLRDGAVVRVL